MIPRKNSFIIDLENFAPFCKCSCGIPNRYIDIRASVSALFFLGCPSTVIGFIVAIVVYAVNCQIFLVSICHCPLIKRLKTFFPLIANSNAATAPPIKPRVVRVITSAFHSLPFLINPCSALLVLVVLCQVHLVLCFFKATARFYCSTQQTI